MAEVTLLPISPQCQEPMLTAQSRSQPLDTDFDIARTFSVLLVTLIVPVYLGLSVAAYSLAAIY